MSLIPKLIRSMGSPEANEAEAAAKALLRALPSEGWEVWTKAQAQQPTPQKSKPFDYTKVETATTLYTEGKTSVNMNKVLKAVREMVADVPRDDLVVRYIIARLHALGFKSSATGITFSR